MARLDGINVSGTYYTLGPAYINKTAYGRSIKTDTFYRCLILYGCASTTNTQLTFAATGSKIITSSSTSTIFFLIAIATDENTGGYITISSTAASVQMLGVYIYSLLLLFTMLGGF